MNDKHLMCRLVEVYGKLLTKKQREIANFYYFCDLSLGEISEILEISRQSVNDALNRVRQEVCEFEDKLGLIKIFDEIKLAISDTDEETYKKIMEIIE